MTWEAWKQWPGLLPLDDLTACTDAEVAWVEMHQLIDRGLQCCAACDTFGWHVHCGACGRRYVGADLTRRDCPQCKAVVVTDYCPHCGEWVAIPFLKRLEAGEVDWLAEAEAAGKLLAKLSQNRALTEPGGPDPTGRAAAIAAVLKRVAPTG